MKLAFNRPPGLMASTPLFKGRRLADGDVRELSTDPAATVSETRRGEYFASRSRTSR